MINEENKLDQNDPIIEVIHNIPIKDCDFFCNTIYADKCKFYIQDMEQKMCEIWKVEEDDYIHNCTKREGPVFPDLTADNKMPSSCASKNCSVSKKLSSSSFFSYKIRANELQHIN